MSFIESGKYAGTTDGRDLDQPNAAPDTSARFDLHRQAADRFINELLAIDAARTPRTASENGFSFADGKAGQVHEFGTTIVSYKDAQIDNHLAFSQARNLRINDIPNDCRISGWKDSVGYYFYFTDGRDGKKHHYIPATCQFIQAVQENGQRATISVAELKQQIDKAMKPKPATV
jgi:hypothetical protein